MWNCMDLISKVIIERKRLLVYVQKSRWNGGGVYEIAKREERITSDPRSRGREEGLHKLRRRLVHSSLSERGTCCTLVPLRSWIRERWDAGR